MNWAERPCGQRWRCVGEAEQASHSHLLPQQSSSSRLDQEKRATTTPLQASRWGKHWCSGHAQGHGSQRGGEGELEGTMLPLARRPSISCASPRLCSYKSLEKQCFPPEPGGSAKSRCWCINYRGRVQQGVRAAAKYKQAVGRMKKARQPNAPDSCKLTGTISLPGPFQLWRGPSSHFSPSFQKQPKCN